MKERLGNNMKRLDYSKEINLIKQHGGHLYFGRCSWSLHVYEHKAWPNDPTCASTKTTTLSGYYNINDSHEILDLCLQNNIPVIDTRNTSIDQAMLTIKMPLISSKGKFSVDSQETCYVSLETYKKVAEDRQHDFIKFYNI